MAINDTINQFPLPVPVITEQTQEDFSLNADSAIKHMAQEVIPKTNSIIEDINSTSAEINSLEQSTQENAANAETFAGLANYKGAWSAGSYALNETVYHNSTFWISGINLNTDEPGVTVNWQPVASAGTVGNLTSPLLDLPLKNSLAMKAGVGSVTFTRSTTGTYIDRYGVLQTAAIDEPRFEKDGLLIEGASTNVCLDSEDFTTGNWTKRGASSASISAVQSPDGSSFMSHLTGLGIGGTDDVYQFLTTLTDGDRCEPSIWMMGDGVSTTGVIRLRLKTGNAGSGNWNIDLSLLSTTRPERITRDHPAVTVGIEFIASATGSYFAISADQSGLSVYAWGAQMEQLPFSSSYIKTTGSQLTRAADIVQVPVNGNIPSLTDNFTVLVDFDYFGFENFNGVFGFETGGVTTERVSINADDQISFVKDGAGTASTTVINQNQVYRIAYCSGDAQYVDGLFDVNNSTAITTTKPDTIHLGRGFVNSDLYGHISNFRIYDRLLTAAEARIA